MFFLYFTTIKLTSHSPSPLQPSFTKHRDLKLKIKLNLDIMAAEDKTTLNQIDKLDSYKVYFSTADVHDSELEDFDYHLRLRYKLKEKEGFKVQKMDRFDAKLFESPTYLNFLENVHNATMLKEFNGHYGLLRLLDTFARSTRFSCQLRITIFCNNEIQPDLAPTDLNVQYYYEGSNSNNLCAFVKAIFEKQNTISALNKAQRAPSVDQVIIYFLYINFIFHLFMHFFVLY